MSTKGTWELGEVLEGQTLVLELIARGESLYQVLDTLCRVIQSQCPGMLASILLLDPDGSHVRRGAAPDLPEDYVRGMDGLPIGPQAGSCGTAAFTREPVIVGDIATDPLWNDYRAIALKNDLRACWSTPIFDSERRVLGTFGMYFRVPGLPNQSHLRLIDISTHIAAIAITVARQFNIRLEERVNERIRIARELHDTLLQSFQGALLQFKAVYNLFSRRPEDAKRTLGEAIDRARGAITEARDLIQDLRTLDSQDRLENLFRAAGPELAAAWRGTDDSPAYRVTVEGVPKPLLAATQEEVFRIGREALSNAFQHANATQIEAEINYGERLFSLRISDDGMGIERTVLVRGAREGHWGLPGIRERAKRIGGQLEISSDAQSGTEVELRIASTIAYAKSQIRRHPGLSQKERETSL